MRFSAVALLLAVLMTACTSSQRNTQGGAIPPWVMRLPEAKGKLYAMGISGPTYYLEDGKTNAAENARKELAKSLSTHVQELSLMMQRGEARGRGFSSDSLIVGDGHRCHELPDPRGVGG